MSEILKRSREICQMLEIKPARSKGQNFLINEKIYDAVVKAAEIKPDDIILEVGPGLGFLTVKMAEQAKTVIAVELDDKLANYLRIAVDSTDRDNIHIINQDILKFNLADFFESHGLDKNTKYKIVANLPYNISSIFLRTFLTAELKPESVTLMLQKEVAERIITKEPDNNLLALSVAFYGEAKIIREVKAGNFWPEPEVDSAIIHIDLHKKDKDDYFFNKEKEFFSLLKIAFSAKRKMLKNNLAAGLKQDPLDIEKKLLSANIELKSRAEDLSLADFKNLFEKLV